jgi:uncharacterized SAM-binding protein YcdF (DUF218 family)
VIRKRLAIRALLAALVVGYAAREPALRTAGRFLVAEDPPAHADAIVVLGGSFPDRILEAVALYEEGLAPRIVLCREPEGKAVKRLRERGVQSASGTDRNRDVAVQLGIPEASIDVLPRQAGSTFGEANQVLRYMKEHRVQSILLVTSKVHTRRAGWIYRHLAPPDAHILVRAARDDGFQPETWWKNRVSTRRVVIEYEKLLVYLLADQWRRKPPESS